MPWTVYNRRKIFQKSKNRKVENQKVEKRQKLKKWNFAENVPLETKVKTAQLLVKETNKAVLASVMDAASQVIFWFDELVKSGYD